MHREFTHKKINEYETGKRHFIRKKVSKTCEKMLNLSPMKKRHIKMENWGWKGTLLYIPIVPFKLETK